MATLVYKVLRKSDGKFLGNKAWGETHSAIGKTYGSLRKALAAFKATVDQGQNSKRKIDRLAEDHEVVEYETRETKRFPIAIHD